MAGSDHPERERNELVICLGAALPLVPLVFRNGAVLRATHRCGGEHGICTDKNGRCNGRTRIPGLSGVQDPTVGPLLLKPQRGKGGGRVVPTLKHPGLGQNQRLTHGIFDLLMFPY